MIFAAFIFVTGAITLPNQALIFSPPATISTAAIPALKANSLKGFELAFRMGPSSERKIEPLRIEFAFRKSHVMYSASYSSLDSDNGCELGKPGSRSDTEWVETDCKSELRRGNFQAAWQSHFSQFRYWIGPGISYYYLRGDGFATRRKVIFREIVVSPDYAIHKREKGFVGYLVFGADRVLFDHVAIGLEAEFGARFGQAVTFLNKNFNSRVPSSQIFWGATGARISYVF